MVTIPAGEEHDRCIEGLQCVYNAYERGLNEYLEPTTVAGYPAAFSSNTDDRAGGEWVLSAGVAENQYIMVRATAGATKPDEGEELALSAAEEVIRVLKEGQ
jgi:hypothetical protein